MVTGDNIMTATAIAIEAGILTAQEAKNEFVCMRARNLETLRWFEET